MEELHCWVNDKHSADPVKFAMRCADPVKFAMRQVNAVALCGCLLYSLLQHGSLADGQ